MFFLLACTKSHWQNMSSTTGLCARSNKRPLYTEDSMADSNTLLAKPEKHQDKIKEDDGTDTVSYFCSLFFFTENFNLI